MNLLRYGKLGEKKEGGVLRGEVYRPYVMKGKEWNNKGKVVFVLVEKN